MAKAFAQASAASLILTALEESELEQTKQMVLQEQPSCRVVCRGLDVRHPAAVRQFVQEAAAWAGQRIDVLCANAGISPPLEEVAEGDADAWWQGLEVNLRGPYLFARFVLPVMRRQGGGRVVFTASRAATRADPLMSSYQVAKLAVTRLADCIHAENHHLGIRTFAIHPGGIVTRLLTDMEDKCDAVSKLATEHIRPQLREDISLPGNVCVWLASGRADFLSGRYVDCTMDVGELERQQEAIVEKDLLKVIVSGNWSASGGLVKL